MRWPWQKRKPDPAEVEIVERMIEHRKTLIRVDQVLRTAHLVADYERADRERRQ